MFNNQSASPSPTAVIPLDEQWSTLPSVSCSPGWVRFGGIAIGCLMVVLCAAAVGWGHARFAVVPQASQNLVFHRAGLFLINTLSLLFALSGLMVVAVSASVPGKRRAVALTLIGLSGMILCVALRHLVVNFFLPWYELKRLVVFLPPTLLWIFNDQQSRHAQARKFGLLRALASGMALALAVPALIIRAEGLLNTWRLPHLFATTYHGLIGLRILLIASLAAGAAITAMGTMAMADEWRGGGGRGRRWTNYCFVVLIIADLVSVAARTVYFDDRQLDDLLTRWIFIAFWLLLAVGGMEWAATVLGQTHAVAPANANVEHDGGGA